jgi:hypothetical protein
MTPAQADRVSGASLKIQSKIKSKLYWKTKGSHLNYLLFFFNPINPALQPAVSADLL